MHYMILVKVCIASLGLWDRVWVGSVIRTRLSAWAYHTQPYLLL